MSKDETGFTLLEVMVALLILSLSLSALFQNLSLSKHISLKSNITIEAVRIANNLFRDGDLMNSLKENPDAEGEVEETGWKYTLRMDPLVVNMGEEEDGDVEVPGMQKIEMTLSYHVDSMPRNFRFIKWVR